MRLSVDIFFVTISVCWKINFKIRLDSHEILRNHMKTMQTEIFICSNTFQRQEKNIFAENKAFGDHY